MQPNRPYRVQNSRPRRMVQLFGRVLPSLIHGSESRSSMDLTEDEFRSPQVQELLRLGRLKILRQPGREGQPGLDVVEPGLALESLEPANGFPESSLFPEESKPLGEVDASVDASPLDPEPVDASPVDTSPVNTTSQPAELTAEKLSALAYRELQSAARELGLSAGGDTETLIQRILSHLQVVESGT